MYKSTKAKAIPQRVKDIVFERDDERCVLCGSNKGQPNAHYISRAQGGLGIEENIVTLCYKCHFRYDNTEDREKIKAILRNHLENIYPHWCEEKLIYKKGEM